jgi:hypothetical protein
MNASSSFNQLHSNRATVVGSSAPDNNWSRLAYGSGSPDSAAISLESRSPVAPRPVLPLSAESLKNKPKRALSAYNFFFQAQRRKILKDTPTRQEGKPRRSHGKIGFKALAMEVAKQWKSISNEDKAEFLEMAARDKDRYTQALSDWKAKYPYVVETPNDCRSVPSMIHMPSMNQDPLDILMQFVPPEPVATKPSAPPIADLAEKLDPESLDMLVSMFRS